MQFDSTLMAALAAEIRAFRGARLRDVWQGCGLPREEKKPDEQRAVYLSWRDGVLLLDAHPQRARLHWISDEWLREATPSSTPLSNVLRKALRGAELVDVEQLAFDRVLHLRFEGRDEIGEIQRHTLVIEIMERRSNIILLDEDGVIVDAVKRLPPFLNRARTVLPHREYEAPPGGRENPLEVTNWESRVLEAHQNEGEKWDLVSWLRKNFNGISPLVAAHLQNTIADASDAKIQAEVCAQFFQQAKSASEGDFSPTLCGNQPYPFALKGKECAPKRDLSTLIEEQIRSEADMAQEQSFRAALLSYLLALRKRNGAQMEDVARAEKYSAEASQFQLMGQMILAHIPQVEEATRRGETKIELSLEAWGGAPDEILSIALENKWSAADNATRYFNRYKRAQKLAGDAPKRRAELESEAAQIEEWETTARDAQSLDELQRVARICGMENRRENKTLSRTKQQEEAGRPENKLRRRDFEGWQLWMGRSAEENQTLLSRVASPSDTWMHVRGMPSAHVLVKNQKGKVVPPRVLEEAARWLASTLRLADTKNVSTQDDPLVPLEFIYTPAKFVRPVKGAPGKVTLQRFETFNLRV